MKRKVIELEIIDEIEESGVSAISLVDAPAINVEWMAFKKQEFVKPQGGESEDEFLNRCIPAMLDEGRDQDQAVAMCYSMYENMERIELADYPWDECIQDQLDRGQDQESAENICGWIRANMSIDTSNLPPYIDELPKKKKFAEDIKVGDAVSWTTGGQNPRGRIRDIIREGSKKVPGADFEITGTPENPGYLIEVYEEIEGKWKPTGKLVGRKADSILKNVQLNGQFPKNSAGDSKNETARRTQSNVDVSRATQYTNYFSTHQNGSKTRYFIEEDQRIIVGPAMIPGLEIVRQDEDTDEIYYVKFSEQTVSKIAEKFMRELRNRETNVLHREDLPADSYVMESWIVETEDDKAMTKYGFNVPIGTWMVKMRVTNPKVWKLVKEGKLRGLSIEGSFVDKEEIADLERAKILDKIIKILNEEE
jgi:hypothetical protein